jgi:hypothetical protein
VAHPGELLSPGTASPDEPSLSHQSGTRFMIMGLLLQER